MDRARQILSGPGGLFVRIVFLILGLFLVYYVYIFLYDTKKYNDNIVIDTVVLARETAKGPAKQFFNSSNTEKKTVAFTNGGDFSISYWMYIQDTTFRRDKNKFIFSLGPDPDTTTTNNSLSIIGYLTAFNYSLAIRTNGSGPETSLNPTEVSSLFSSAMTTPADITNSLTPCDIASVDLQKWVHVTITYSSKTLDVYMDGKLARSCILDRSIYIAPVNQLTLFDKEGFGGYVSNFRTHDYTLNPEQIWRLYMAGPGPAYTLWQYIKSLWDPESVGTLSYPMVTNTT
jgi:hypothetical protein